jgi:hypothetical protein
MSAERVVITCPRATSDDTPCAARDGHLAVFQYHDNLTGSNMEGRCVGCEQNVADLFKDLVKRHVESTGARISA